MKITISLLEKYASGNCTPEECRRVEEWMPGDADITRYVSEDKLEMVSGQMWQNISRNTRQPAKKVALYKSLIRYAAAACMVLGLCYWSMSIYRCPANYADAAYDNTHAETTLLVRNAGLAITLLPGSKIQLAGSTSDHRANIAVCGDLILENNGPDNISLALTSACNAPDIQDKIRPIRAGKKYAVIQYKSRSQSKHVVVEKRYARFVLADLFPPVKNKVIHKIL